MKRLPSEEELRDIADEVGKQLQTLSVYDFDKVLAEIDSFMWLLKERMVSNAYTVDPDLDFRSYHAGALSTLNEFRGRFEEYKATKAKAN